MRFLEKNLPAGISFSKVCKVCGPVPGNKEVEKLPQVWEGEEQDPVLEALHRLAAREHLTLEAGMEKTIQSIEYQWPGSPEQGQDPFVATRLETGP